MGAAVNGLALSKLRPFGSGFLIFSDYCATRFGFAAHHGVSGHLHLHARFDRRRRGRADPSAGRTAGLAAGDARLDHAAARDANEVVEAWQVIMRLQHEPVA